MNNLEVALEKIMVNILRTEEIGKIEKLKSMIEDLTKAEKVWYDDGCSSCGTQWVFETNYPRKIFFNNKTSFRIMLREKSHVISLIEYRNGSTSIHFINFDTFPQFENFFTQLKS